MPSSELLDRFIEVLVKQYKKDLVETKKRFLKELETEIKKPFEGDKVFKE